jgi:hypothetical protein
MSAPWAQAATAALRKRAAVRFAFEVSGTAIQSSPTNGDGPHPVVRSYYVVGCSPASARETASQLYLADLAAAGLRAAGEITVEVAPPMA